MDGISINISTAVISALFGAGGLAGVLGVLGKFKRKPSYELVCSEHKSIADRITQLEKNDACKTELLKSIDKRLETLTKLILKNV